MVFFMLQILFLNYGINLELNSENVIYSFLTKDSSIVSFLVDANEEYVVFRLGYPGSLVFEHIDSILVDTFRGEYFVSSEGPSNFGMELTTVSFSENNIFFEIIDGYYAEPNEYLTAIVVVNDTLTILDVS